MFKNGIILIIIFGMFINNVYTQTSYSHVIGMVVDSNQNSIPYTTIQFLNSDSVTKYASMCNELGIFKIDSVESGEYSMKISSVGYKSINKTITIKDNESSTRINPITLHTDIYQLGEVEVSANLSGYVSYADKSVFYPDSSNIKSSKNALDLINKVPEIRVNKQNDVIKVLGSANVLVLINGVQNNRVLKAISPNDIEKVEVITHPSAKYRSDITSIVNIVLKDKRKQGIDVYSNISLCINNKNHSAFTQISYNFKNLRFFLNYDIFLSKSIDSDSTHRNEGLNDYYTTSLNNPSYDWNSQSFQYGFDYIPNKTLSINFTGKFNFRRTIGDDIHKSVFIQNDTSLIDQIISSDYKVNNHIQQNYSLYFKKEINKKNLISSTTNFYLLNQVLNSNINTTTIYDSFFRTEKSEMQQFSVNSKIDYTYKLNEKINFESGYQFYSRNINTEVDDNVKISILKYVDFRNSLYANSIYKLNKNGMQVGLRVENLNIALYDTIKNNYTKLLPYISFNHRFNRSKNIHLSYNQRLRYPSYYQLNPYAYYSADSISVSSGNAYLTPEISNIINTQFSLNHKKVNTLLSLEYRNINNIIVQSLETANGFVELKYHNMGKTDKYTSKLNISTTIFKLIEFQTLISVTYNLFKNREEFNGFSYNSYIEIYAPLFWDMEFELSISLFSKEITYNGYEKINTMIDEILISKYIFNDNFIIGFSVWEPFFKATGHENIWTDTYSEKTYYETINNTCYMFNLTFMLNKGKKSKKVDSELNMEDNYY